MVLIHYAYLPLVWRQVGNIFFFQDNPAFLGPVKPYYGFKEQGLSAACRAYKRQIISFFGFELNPAEFKTPNVKAEVPDLKETHSLPPSNLSKLKIARKAIPMSKIPLVIAISRFP